MLETQQQFELTDLAQFLDSAGISYTKREEDKTIMTTYDGGLHGPVIIRGRVYDDQTVLTFGFRLPLIVPEPKRDGLAEAITRANYGLLLGNFEMDMDDGQLNYKVTVPIDEASLSHTQLEHCFGVALGAIERYLVAFYQIIFADASPEEAISACEV